ncbi:hypothetical protein [uncultured Duncaniella sp.]|uniref:hypothetical protein n=1 Tax=uncultured Duncaniella sp. TaxID=2768039 RepID=UPI0027121F00|nr:hypothetical protein [uncultured Duncaniella sp.]
MIKIKTPGWMTMEQAYEAICKESENSGDVVYADFAGVVMRSDQSLISFKQRFRERIRRKQQQLIDCQKDPRVKMSVIRNVLDNFIVLGSLDKKVSDSIINQIKQEI